MCPLLQLSSAASLHLFLLCGNGSRTGLGFSILLLLKQTYSCAKVALLLIYIWYFSVASVEMPAPSSPSLRLPPSSSHLQHFLPPPAPSALLLNTPQTLHVVRFW
jgi:hypothetical protein